MAYNETAFRNAIDGVEAINVSAGHVDLQDICGIYKKVQPILDGLVPFIERIPVWGPKAATAITLLMKTLDVVCRGSQQR